MFPGPRSIILVGALLFYNSVFTHFSHISHFRSIIPVGALLFYNSVFPHFSHISHFRSIINVYIYIFTITIIWYLSSISIQISYPCSSISMIERRHSAFLRSETALAWPFWHPSAAPTFPSARPVPCDKSLWPLVFQHLKDIYIYIYIYVGYIYIYMDNTYTYIYIHTYDVI